MILSLVALGPIYSAVYTEVGIHPDGFIAHVTAQDPDIPRVRPALGGTKYQEYGGIRLNVFLGQCGKPAAFGCRFRPVKYPISMTQ